MATVVTSFSPKGYEEYGRDFLRTFKEFWPTHIRLVLYLEPVAYPDLGEWECIHLDAETMPEWFNFYEGIKRFPMMLGQTPGGYDIRYDAAMARKSFIQADAVKEYGGKVFWIDADTITHSHVPDEFLDQMLPDDKLNCYLGRDGWMYTESGFIGFNAAHPYCEAFMRGYLRVFTQGYIFTQPQWHDCIGFDMARRQLQPDYFYNLAANLPHGTMHPFVNSRLGAYLDHRKGNRKASRSTRSDLVIKREEPYWNV